MNLMVNSMVKFFSCEITNASACCEFCFFHHIAQYLAVHRQLDSKEHNNTDKGTGERGVACCHGYKGVTVSFNDVRLALRAVRPSAMREVAIEVPKVRETTTILQKTFKKLPPLTHPKISCLLKLPDL